MCPESGFRFSPKSSNFFDAVMFLLASLVTGLKFHANVITGSGVMTILVRDLTAHDWNPDVIVKLFWRCRVRSGKFSYWSKFHVNIISGSGVMAILVLVHKGFDQKYGYYRRVMTVVVYKGFDQKCFRLSFRRYQIRVNWFRKFTPNISYILSMNAMNEEVETQCWVHNSLFAKKQFLPSCLQLY